MTNKKICVKSIINELNTLEENMTERIFIEIILKKVCNMTDSFTGTTIFHWHKGKIGEYFDLNIKGKF